MDIRGTAWALARASHLGPTLVVTGLAGYLGTVDGLAPQRLLLVLGAVGSGQVSIGWSNDLIDAGRDRSVHRLDKPLVSGDLSSRGLVAATAFALTSTAVLSSRLGLAAGLVHGFLVVGSGWAYNLGLKRTRLSILPYVIAFGALPRVTPLSGIPARTGPGWRSVTGALLGVAAHCLNVLPDRSDDADTGVRGTTHRLSQTRVRRLAVAAEATATMVTLLGTRAAPRRWVVVCMMSAPLMAVAIRGRGAAPFQAVQGLAVLNAALLGCPSTIRCRL